MRGHQVEAAVAGDVGGPDRLRDVRHRVGHALEQGAAAGLGEDLDDRGRAVAAGRDHQVGAALAGHVGQFDAVDVRGGGHRCLAAPAVGEVDVDHGVGSVVGGRVRATVAVEVGDPDRAGGLGGGRGGGEDAGRALGQLGHAGAARGEQVGVTVGVEVGGDHRCGLRRTGEHTLVGQRSGGRLGENLHAGLGGQRDIVATVTGRVEDRDARLAGVGEPGVVLDARLQGAVGALRVHEQLVVVGLVEVEGRGQQHVIAPVAGDVADRDVLRPGSDADGLQRLEVPGGLGGGRTGGGVPIDLDVARQRRTEPVDTPRRALVGRGGRGGGGGAEHHDRRHEGRQQRTTEHGFPRFVWH